jgi:hypothetical protein
MPATGANWEHVRHITGFRSRGYSLDLDGYSEFRKTRSHATEGKLCSATDVVLKQTCPEGMRLKEVEYCLGVPKEQEKG